MDRYRVIISTKAGAEVESDELKLSEDELKQVHDLLQNTLSSSNGYLRVESDGSFAWVPVHAVDNVLLHKV